MGALFSPRSNTLIRGAILCLAVLGAGVPLLLMWWVRTPQVTGQGHAVEQPIPLFSHQIHVTGLQIDCRYCHSAAERSATAGMPSSATCLPCHNWAWRQSAIFDPVQRSITAGRPIPWQRVNQLPDFVFFNHAIHVNKGVGCESCHGRVDQMAVVRQAQPLTMSWCLDCHQEPEKHLRPIEQMTTMGWHPDVPQQQLGRQLKQQYGVRELTNCTACHR